MPTHLSLTPQMLVTIAEIKKRIGILTVKDVVTGGNPHAKPYGVQYAPIISRNLASGVETLDGNIKHERVIQIWHPDSDVFPGGVPIGATRVYQRKQLRDFGGDEDFKLIRAEEDICFDEQRQVRALAYGRPWWTKEMRDADEQAKIAMRAKRAYSDLDPSTALAKAIVAALKSTGNLAAAGIPDDGPGIPIVSTEEAARAAEVEAGVPGAEKIDLRTRAGRDLKAKRDAEALALAGAPPK